jgi:hypothetical protein
VDFSFVRPNKLERIPIVPREIKAYDDRPGEKVQAVVKYEIDIGAHNHAEIRGGVLQNTVAAPFRQQIP